MVDIKDLAGFSEPLTKLVETISAGVGALYEPRRIRERAKAEVDARVTQTLGEVEAAEVLRHAQARLMAREVRRQRNLEGIAAHAERQLPASVNSEPVDRDWFTEFLNYSQDVSNEDMQSLWGRILAGEVAKPGSFSRRSLAVVRLLDRGEANTFTKLCSLLWKIESNGYVHFRPMESDEWEGEFESVGVKSGHLVHLETIGLVAQAPGPIVATFIFERGKPEVLTYFGRRFEVTASEHYDPVERTILPLTEVGNELAPICGARPQPEVVEKTIEDLRNAMLTIQEIT